MEIRALEGAVIVGKYCYLDCNDLEYNLKYMYTISKIQILHFWSMQNIHHL